MRYELDIRARARTEETIEHKHDTFMKGLTAIPQPWGLGGRQAPPAPDPGSELSAGLSLKKFLGKGVYSANVCYEYRREFRDEGSDDDLIAIDLNPRKADYRSLVLDVFPAYVRAFGAYLGEIGDVEFTHVDFDKEGELKLNCRNDVYRIRPVSFFDAELCRRAFGLAPTDIVVKLQGKVERVSSICNGVYIVGSAEPLEFEDADRLCWQIKEWIMS